MKRSTIGARNRFTKAFKTGIFACILVFGLSSWGIVPTYYWDANGTDDGPGNPPSGVWSNSSLTWNTDYYGQAQPFAYDTRANIVFAATGDAYWSDTYDYTISIDGTVQVSDIIFRDGNATLTNLSGTVEKDTAPIAVYNDTQLATLYSGLSSAAGTSNGITKYAFGILVLAGTNTYRGPTTIEGGVLRLGRSQTLPQSSALVLANGGTEGYSDTPATFEANGFTQSMGALLVAGPNTNIPRTIDFGNGASSLAFAASQSQNWNSTPLRIINFTPGVDSLRVGTNNTGLTAIQLGLIQFANYLDIPGKIDSNGFVTPDFPVIHSVTQTGPTTWRLSWNAIPGRQYLIQYKNNLSDASWTDDGVAVIPTDPAATFDDEVGANVHRFYRIALFPVQHPI